MGWRYVGTESYNFGSDRLFVFVRIGGETRGRSLDVVT
jgi:hypothetical protein